MVRLGEPLTKDELDEMIKDADINRNGKKNYKGDNFEFQNNCCTSMKAHTEGKSLWQLLKKIKPSC